MASTPGPWRQHTEFPDRIIVNGSCVYQVRDMTTEGGFAGNGYGQPNPDDTLLMAAAPELLNALKSLVACCDNHSDWSTVGELLDPLRAADRAIATAEGRSE